MTAVLKALRSEEHISVSALNTYLRCPRQYENRYILHNPAEHRSSALAFGSAIHEALAFFYSRMRADGSEPTSEELAQSFRDAWRDQLDRDVPVLFSEKESEETLTDLGVRMLSVFLEKAPRPEVVIDVETAWSIELIDHETGEVLPRLVGVFDAVVRNGERFRILEHKTGARKWTDDKLSFDPQITAYTLAARHLGLSDAPVTIQLLTKVKAPSLEIYTPSRTDADRDDFVEMAAGVMKAVNAGAFFVCRGWHCGSCEFASRCVAG